MLQLTAWRKHTETARCAIGGSASMAAKLATAAIFRAKVRRAISGFIPLASNVTLSFDLLFCTTRCSEREGTIRCTPALPGCRLQPTGAASHLLQSLARPKRAHRAAPCGSRAETVWHIL